MLFSVIAYMLLFIITGTSAADISLSDHLLVSSEALFMICIDLSLSNSASISSVCLELILFLLMAYTTYISFFI